MFRPSFEPLVLETRQYISIRRPPTWAFTIEMAAMSPRLPSPPPPAEIQIGPKSPGLGSSAADQELQQIEQTMLNANAKRRIHPGTKSAEMAAGPPLVPLNEVGPLEPPLSRSHQSSSLNQGADCLLCLIARLGFPAPGASGGPALLPHSQQHTAHHPRDRSAAGDTTPIRRQDTVAVRTLPISHSTV